MARLTVRDIITNAYRTANITGIGDYLSDLELNAGMNHLRNVVEELFSQKLWSPSNVKLVYKPDKVSSTYTIGNLIGNAEKIKSSQILSGYYLMIDSPLMANESKNINVLYNNNFKVTDRYVFNEQAIINPSLPMDQYIITNAGVTNTAGAVTIILNLTIGSPLTAGQDIVYSDGETFGYSGIITNVINPNQYEMTVYNYASINDEGEDEVWLETNGAIFLTSIADNRTTDYGVVWTSDDDFDILPDILTEVATPDHINSLKYDNRGGYLYPVKQVGDSDWNTLSISNASPTIPYQFRYNWDYPYGIIEFDRELMNLYDLYIEIEKTIPAFEDANEVIYLKAGYSGYLETRLAELLLASLGMDYQYMMQSANKKLAWIRRSNQQPRDTIKYNNVCGGNAQYYDWRAGTIVNKRTH